MDVPTPGGRALRLPADGLDTAQLPVPLHYADADFDMTMIGTVDTLYLDRGWLRGEATVLLGPLKAWRLRRRINRGDLTVRFALRDPLTAQTDDPAMPIRHEKWQVMNVVLSENKDDDRFHAARIEIIGTGLAWPAASALAYEG